MVEIMLKSTGEINLVEYKGEICLKYIQTLQTGLVGSRSSLNPMGKMRLNLQVILF